MSRTPLSNTSIYDRNDYYDSDGSATRLSPIFNRLLYFLDWFKAYMLLRKLDAKAPKIALDIGAGDGKFLSYLKRFGFQVYGTTASQVSKNAAKEIFSVDIAVDTQIPAALQERVYGLITYWHVFEHLESPQSHVELWQKLLDSNGTIVIEVPNPESFGAKLAFHAWLGSDVEHHINHMNKDQICQLLAVNGLKVKRVETLSLKFTYVFLWSALLGAIFRKTYDFDKVFALLKRPGQSLLQAPISTLNGLASVVYLFPIIVIYTILGVLFRRGEVLRIYASHSDVSG